jgi:hypothetical protein
MSQKAKNVVDKILAEMDKTILLGAALDCMSDSEKIALEKKIENLIQGAIS